MLRVRRLLAANIPTKVIRGLMPGFVGDGTDLDTRVADLQRARLSLGELLVGAGAATVA